MRDRIGVGFVGSGSVFWEYLDVLDRCVAGGTARLGAVYARRKEGWPALLSRRPDLVLVNEVDALLQSDVDVVVVVTPSSTHSRFIRLALEHGKHVVAEKPLASDRAEASELRNLAERQGLMLISAPFVVSPAFKILWKLIEEGTLGEIHSARGLHGSAGYSWASWYHEEDALGIFAEQAPYNLKCFTTLLGAVTDVVSSIDRTILAPRTVAGKQIERPAVDVSFATVRHIGGAVTSLVASSVIQRYRRRPLELYGTEGTVNLVGEVWRPEGVEIWESKKGYLRDLDARDDRWSWCDGLRNAIYALRNEETLMASIDQDLHILEVVEAARRSAIEQRPISVGSRFSLTELRQT